jgi:DNA primase
LAHFENQKIIMYTEESIQAVRNRMDIIDVVGSFVKLNRSNQACCPFHDEKTPSFSVSTKHQRWHCYGGCGEGGDSISFIQKQTNKTFIEAIVWLADRYNITLQEEKESPEQKLRREQVKDEKLLMQQAVEKALKFYRKRFAETAAEHSLNKYLLEKRQLTRDICDRWQFGYAAKDGIRLTSHLIESKLYNAAEQVGLVKTQDGTVKDFFWNRIIIPIHDQFGTLIGFGGRWLPTGDQEYDKQQAKYFNPKESLLYRKSATWFGLYQAITAKAFKSINGVNPPAVITEGYLDVISLHEAGVFNAVASCGTAVTIEQIRLLKRYTEHFVILTDGDSAGEKAAMKLVDLCLQENVRCDVIGLPEGMDPDDYVKHFINQEEPVDGAFAD